jgi:hypothetical protein
MHNACYGTYRRSNGKCPACGEDWGRVGNDTVKPIGEAAAPKDDWPRRTRRTATEESEGEQQQQQSDDAEADADADVDVDVDAQPATAVSADPPPPGPSSQPSVRRNQPRAVKARYCSTAPVIRKADNTFSVPHRAL